MVSRRTFGWLVELATTQIVLYGVSDPMVRHALQQLADTLRHLDLADDDRQHVDRFAAKLASRSDGEV